VTDNSGKDSVTVDGDKINKATRTFTVNFTI